MSGKRRSAIGDLLSASSEPGGVVCELIAAEGSGPRAAGRHRPGFTLVEMLITIGIFSVVIVLLLGVFVGTIRRQRELVALQASLTDLRFASELISREMATGYGYEVNKATLGQGIEESCPNTNFNCLTFTNQASEIITFWVDSVTQGDQTLNRLMRRKWNADQSFEDTSLSSDKSNANISRLDGILGGSSGNERITIILNVAPLFADQQPIIIQTTAASRQYQPEDEEVEP